MKRAIFDESANVKTSLTVQLAIIALQNVDLFAQNQQTALSKRKDVSTGCFETIKSKIKTDKVKKPARANDTNSFLTSLSSDDDFTQRDYLGLNIKDNHSNFKNIFYIF